MATGSTISVLSMKVSGVVGLSVSVSAVGSMKTLLLMTTPMIDVERLARFIVCMSLLLVGALVGLEGAVTGAFCLKV